MKPSTMNLIWLTLMVPSAFAWAPQVSIRRPAGLVCRSSETDVMEGASTFERWFAAIPGATIGPTVSHANFGNLRGLAITPSGIPSGSESIVKVPKSIVLQSDFSQANWDAELAQKIWFECTKGPSSMISGYVALLTRGWTPADLPELPPSTAPDALRHWTDEQKSLLADSTVGQKLLDLEKQQEGLWEKKFSAVSGMTYEQFRWAMEVVHSRAFQGDFGIGGAPIPPVVTAVVPLLASAAGYAYFSLNTFPEDSIMVGLGLLAVLPTIVNAVSQSPPAAVLLPMIDSFNHLEEADSSIEYDPLSDSFSLSVGSKCAVEEDGKVQLYISYGAKKDTELLLNYGFLKGVSLDGDADSRRKALADAFLEKQT